MTKDTRIKTPAKAFLAALTRSVVVIAMLVIAQSIPGADGVSWAGPADTTKADLSGRWSGAPFGYGVAIAPKDDCGKKPCNVTYDIVACDTGWCGIQVTDGATCGPIAMRLADTQKPNQPPSFEGKLELAKGSAPFVIRAWLDSRLPIADGGEGARPTRLSMIGDTGSELLMLRRSYPLHANLNRIGEAVCTLEKATS